MRGAEARSHIWLLRDTQGSWRAEARTTASVRLNVLLAAHVRCCSSCITRRTRGQNYYISNSLTPEQNESRSRSRSRPSQGSRRDDRRTAADWISDVARSRVIMLTRTMLLRRPSAMMPGRLQPSTRATAVQNILPSRSSLISRAASSGDGPACDSHDEWTRDGPDASLGFDDSSLDGPDASLGFDVTEYDGLWRALTRDSTWPSDRSIAIVGPTGDAFRETVEASCEAAMGCEVLSLKAQAKSRWQSVRVLLRCESPDAFCAVHSVLSSLDGTKAII